MRIYRRLHLITKTYLMLIVFHFGLMILGNYRMIYLTINSFPVNLYAKPFLSAQELRNEIIIVRKIILHCCSYFPFKAECMHQSLLAFSLIRRRLGIPVDIHVGVKKFPFAAHAWITLDGKNVFDSVKVTDELSVILSSEWGGIK